MSDLETIGARIKAARLAKGLRQYQVEAAIGSGKASMSRWEHAGEGGDRSRIPTSEWLAKIARALDVTERWLVTGDGPRESRSVLRELEYGRAALDAVLATYEWPPDVGTEAVDAVLRDVLAEADTSDGRLRPASVWRHRIGQMLQARRSSRPRQIMR